MSAALAVLVQERLALLPFAVTADALLRRDAPGGLADPGLRSANGHCRMVAARDGWLAVNLARREDTELVPALTARGGDPWQALADAARNEPTAGFVSRAIEFHMPVAQVAEAAPQALANGVAGDQEVRVLDLSALWAGPLCAALLACAGAEVVRIESTRRPDPTPQASPRLDAWLNGGKRRVPLDLTSESGHAALREQLALTDVLVTSARSGALARLGLDDALLAARPGLIWLAVTAHGWDADRVGFGDDCAAAGGLVAWRDDAPHFIGDALADPLTGLEAALAVRQRIARGEGGRLDIALARVAAAYAKAVA